jgi:hypothetical protein
MKCREARRLFGAYWDDELTQGEREWLEVHFASCPGCRTSYETLARSLELVSGLPRIEPAPDLAARALARARRMAPVADRLPTATPRWVPALAAAAVLVVAGVAVTRLVPTGRVNEPVAVRATDPAPAPAAEVVLPVPVATSDAPIEEPQLVADAGFPDSLFDHSADVEFILDPVTVRRGQAHPASRLAPPITRGEQATITF